MKKIKLIVLSSALSLITIGVFAGRTKFVPANLYADTGNSGNPADMQQIDNASAFPGLTTTPSGNQARIVSSQGGSPQYDLYTNDGGSFIAVYTSGF